MQSTNTCRTTDSRPVMPTGSSDFDEVVLNGSKIIDKTKFIQGFMERGGKVCRILRPRRFGKSTNLNMLKSFLSLGAKADDFKRFDIGKNQAFLDKHCGQYPVVFLDLKDCKGLSWEEMYKAFWRSIRATFQRHGLSPMNAFQELDPSEQDVYGAVHNEEFSVSLLLWLTDALYKKYNKKVIVLIDEYDAPLNEAARHGFYKEASYFFGIFYSAALKSDDAIKKACLVGILEIKGAGILSGLNNISTYSVQEELFSDHFGFTKQEITQFLNGDEKTVNRVMEWYNGYQFGSHSLVNPYSFMQCNDKKTFVSAWAGSAALGILAACPKDFPQESLVEILTLLGNNDTEVELSNLSAEMDYSSNVWSLDSVLNFLILTGYLTFRKSPGSSSECHVRVPNKEVRLCWAKEMSKFLNDQGIVDSSQQVHPSRERTRQLLKRDETGKSGPLVLMVGHPSRHSRKKARLGADIQMPSLGFAEESYYSSDRG